MIAPAISWQASMLFLVDRLGPGVETIAAASTRCRLFSERVEFFRERTIPGEPTAKCPCRHCRLCPYGNGKDVERAHRDTVLDHGLAAPAIPRASERFQACAVQDGVRTSRAKLGSRAKAPMVTSADGMGAKAAG
jgi:hypothetical protein